MNKLILFGCLSIIVSLSAMQETLIRTAWIKSFLHGELTIDESNHTVSFPGPIDGDYEISSDQANKLLKLTLNEVTVKEKRCSYNSIHAQQLYAFLQDADVIETELELQDKTSLKKLYEEYALRSGRTIADIILHVKKEIQLNREPFKIAARKADVYELARKETISDGKAKAPLYTKELLEQLIENISMKGKQ